MRLRIHSLTMATGLAVLLLLAGGVPAQEARKPAPLGLNLSGVTDWSSEIVFVDAFKAARAWISQARGKPWGKGGPLDLDSRGNLRSLAEGQYAETVVFTGFEKRFPAGIFTCLYDGEGDLGFTGDARVSKRKPGRLEVEIRPRSGQAFARITRTNPKNPLRNIRLVMPGFEKTYKEQPFHPDFLARWRGFRVFRFMDWAQTNNSKIAQWSDRPTPDMHSQAINGVAAEYAILLCNTLDVEPWLCLPHRATDDHVRRLARLVKDKLKPALRVHVEYSNECWNGQFEQARYCQEQGKQLGLSKNAYEAQLRFYSQRSVEIFRIWEDMFDGKDRLVRVLAAQSANPWTGSTVLTWKDAHKHADVIAIAPYFGSRWGSPRTADKVANMSADELMVALRQDLAEAKKQMTAYAGEARKRGLKLAAYEGGQHLAGHGGAENNDRLTRLFQETNRHAGMSDHYLRHLQDWNAAGGDLFCVFASMGAYSKWGSWGLLEYAGQERERAPKYQAIQQYLKKPARQTRDDR